MTPITLTLDDFRAKERVRETRIVVALVAVSALLAVLVLFAPPGWYALLIALSMAAVALTWYRPAGGIAALLAAALLFEQFNFGSFQPITRTVPLFTALSATSRITFLPLSPFEVALLGLIALTAVRGLGKRLPWNAGPTRFLVPFLAVLALWLAYGLMNGGSASVAVSELRAFVYFASLVYVGAYTIEGEKDARLILGVAAFVVCLKALQAAWEYAFVLRFDLTGIESLTGHEDALFTAWIAVLLAVSLAYKSMPRLSAFVLTMLPLMAVAFMVADRRAAYVALLFGLLALSALLLTDPSKRRVVGRVVPPLLAVLLVLVAVGWNGSGPIAKPGRAIRSIVDPQNEGDATSNYYRRAEEFSLVMSIQRSPFIGLGFGRQFMAAGQLSAIEYEYADYIAHNQIMWLWAKLGTVGFSVFWVMAGGLISYGVVLFRKSRRPLAKTVAALTTCALMMQLVVSYVDMQLTFARNMAFLGVLVALLVCVPRFEEGEAVEPSAS